MLCPDWHAFLKILYLQLRDTDSEISKGGRVIRRIGRRIIQHKIILAVVILVILVIIGLLIFGIVKIHQKTSSS